MRADLLCSGSKGNACLVRSQGCTLMIDCGSTKRHLNACFQQLGLTFQDVDALLVTHGHSDHISQLKHFCAGPVFSCCPLNCERTPVQPGQTFAFGPFAITVVGLSHDALGTVGYMIDDGKSRLVYVTDTGYLQESLRPLLANADAYIFESNHDIPMLMASSRPVFVKQRIISDSGHLCNEDSAKNLACLAGPRTKHIVLAHISEEGNTCQQALDVFWQRFKGQEGSLDVQAARQFEMASIPEF